MAEFLVRAKKHWKDDWTKEKVDSLNEQEKAVYDARSQMGDIVCFYPDGKCTEQPSLDSCYIIIKSPEISNVSKTLSIIDANGKMLKHRRYYIKKQVVQDAIDNGTRMLTLTAQEFNAALKDKNSEK